MSESRDTPTFADVLRTALLSHMADVHVSLPARVIAYDSATQSVSVQPLVRRGYEDEEGARRAERLPIINDVPVVFQGGGGYRVTFPVAVDDTVLLVFAEASIDKWLTGDAGGADIDPLDDRRHALSDAIAIPGLRNFRNALVDAPTDRMSIGNDGGPTIEIDDTEIRLGSNSASALLALKSDVQAIVSLLTGWTVAAGDGGAALKAAAIVQLAAIPVGTTNLKAE